MENEKFLVNLFHLNGGMDSMGKKYVYMFTEGNAKMRNLLGGKGAGLAEMTNLGLPVPPGFTISTEACTQYYEDNREINDEIMGQVKEAIGKLEEITGKKFGDEENPLLVSVRSGARASMPGMMDTILNLGLNEKDIRSIMGMFEPEKDPYKILEIDKTATDEEVRKAYRRLAVKFHPDKVENLGDDVKKAAEEKFKSVQSAYEQIKKERGMK